MTSNYQRGDKVEDNQDNVYEVHYYRGFKIVIIQDNTTHPQTSYYGIIGRSNGELKGITPWNLNSANKIYSMCTLQIDNKLDSKETYRDEFGRHNKVTNIKYNSKYI